MKLARLTALLLGAQSVLGGIAPGLHALTYHRGKTLPVMAVASPDSGVSWIDQSDSNVRLDNACPPGFHAGQTNPIDQPRKTAAVSKRSPTSILYPPFSAIPSAPAAESTQARAPPLS